MSGLSDGFRGRFLRFLPLLFLLASYPSGAQEIRSANAPEASGLPIREVQLLEAIVGTEALTERFSYTVGTVVENRNGDLRGTVADVVISRDGQMRYAVMRFTHPEGIEDRLYLVPQGGLDANLLTQEPFLDLRRSELDDLWMLQDGELPAEVDNLLLAGDLVGSRVVSPEGEELGALEGFMFHFLDQSVQYMALKPANALGMGEKLVAVQMSEIQEIDTEQERIVVRVGREQVQDGPGFGPEDWPAEDPGE